jgi:Family of unknown function (DUF5947)
VSPLASPRLQALARRGEEPAAPADDQERCELCSEPVAPEHRHVIDMRSRQILCACRACAILFDHRAAGGGHYRLLPTERRLLEGFRLDDAAWADLAIPVEMAFFFHSSPVERVVAFYPSPVGATESALRLDAWEDLVAANPVLQGLTADVEALLVHRARGSREHWLLPVDNCYRLVGIIRTRWRGLSGGQEVWEAIQAFFDDLRATATAVRADQTREEG